MRVSGRPRSPLRSDLDVGVEHGFSKSLGFSSLSMVRRFAMLELAVVSPIRPVVRNKSIVQLKPRFPIDTRGANRRESVCQSLVASNASHKLHCNQTNSIDRSRAYLVLETALSS